MHDEAYICIPLRRRNGEVAAVTIIDAVDRHLAEVPWSLSGDNYAAGASWIDGRWRTVSLARMILGLPRHGKMRVDHINRDKLDNRRANLRIVTDAQNAQNRRPRGGASPFRGVNWDSSGCKWRAVATLNGRQYNLGRFDDEREAAAAAAAWRAKNMPFSEDARASA